MRHLALPARRNSGPESEAAKMFSRKSKSKSNQSSKDESFSHYSLRMERRKKTQANNYSAEYLCKNTSSSESLDNIISYKLKGRKGFSLDRNIQSCETENKSQAKPKRSSWFLRDRSRDKQSKKETFLKRSSLDFTVTYDTKQEKQEKPRTKSKTIQRQNAADYTGDSSTTPQEETPEPKKSGLSRFQIGKRFFKGEIGIKSFNYYLLKEGLKKSQSKQKQDSITAKAPPYMSKSEENIYEEIFFHHDLPTPKPQPPPELPPFNKQTTTITTQKQAPQSSDGNCQNCEICLQEEAAQEKHTGVCNIKNCDKCIATHQHNTMTSSLSGSESYGRASRKIDDASIYDFFQQQQQQQQAHHQTMLQFQSYNPNNPNVYKIETTPVAFDYRTMEEQIYHLENNQQYDKNLKTFSSDGKIMTKSSSSSDSLKAQTQRHRQQQFQQQSNEFYTRPNYHYPPVNAGDKQSRKDQNMYKTDSSNSIKSENSLNKIYNSKNSSQKSNQSNKSNHNRDEIQIRQDMSDSSLGDSLFSSDANKRYFGSSESCRFNYENGRRRGSLENDKCSFSDTCRYECNLRNCDCSSSYFSSDFDDTNIYNMKSHQQQQLTLVYDQVYDTKTNRYAEDFIKHVNNVKRRSQNIPIDGNNTMLTVQQTILHYEVPKANPKRLDTEIVRNENDNNKISSCCVIADDQRLKDFDKMLTHNDSKKTKVHNSKATGTVPKLSSSISSTESKVNNPKQGRKLDKESKEKDPKRDQTDDKESLSKVKVNHSDEKFLAVENLPSAENFSPSASLERKVNEQKTTGNDNNDTQKDLQSKIEQQMKPIEQQQQYDDDDDEVFLSERHQLNEKSTEREQNEKQQMVSN